MHVRAHKYDAKNNAHTPRERRVHHSPLFMEPEMERPPVFIKNLIKWMRALAYLFLPGHFTCALLPSLDPRHSLSTSENQSQGKIESISHALLQLIDFVLSGTKFISVTKQVEKYKLLQKLCC
jgi:hypothetical protein